MNAPRSYVTEDRRASRCRRISRPRTMLGPLSLTLPPMPASAPSGSPVRAMSDDASPTDALGREWIVEAYGCEPGLLKDQGQLQGVFSAIISELELNEVRPSIWHTFPGHGGVTGMSLLAESHLTCHTFPEHGTACFNLFCCRPRPEWDFEGRLAAMLGADRVLVRSLARRYVPDVEPGDLGLPGARP